jgi:hypothetical protein
MTDAAQHIATVEKNRAEDVRVALVEYNGHDLVDVRIFASIEGAEERQPTRKGVSLAIRQLPALLEALQAAREAAERRGLIR